MKYLLLLMLLMSDTTNSFALERISSVVFNTGKVQPFFMTPGRRTLILSYCPVRAAPSGQKIDVETEIATYDSTQVWLWLARPSAQGTNVFIICPNEPPMVLEVVPSKDTHQDVLKIVAAVGSTDFQGVPLIEVESNKKLTR